jgi:hypothetical protein
VLQGIITPYFQRADALSGRGGEIPGTAASIGPCGPCGFLSK